MKYCPGVGQSIIIYWFVQIIVIQVRHTIPGTASSFLPKDDYHILRAQYSFQVWHVQYSVTEAADRPWCKLQRRSFEIRHQLWRLVCGEPNLMPYQIILFRVEKRGQPGGDYVLKTLDLQFSRKNSFVSVSMTNTKPKLANILTFCDFF